MEVGKVSATLTADASGWNAGFASAFRSLQQLQAVNANLKAVLPAPDVTAALAAIQQVQAAYQALRAIATQPLPALPAPRNAPVPGPAPTLPAVPDYSRAWDALNRVAAAAQRTDTELRGLAAGNNELARIEANAERGRNRVSELAQRTGDQALAEQALAGVEARRLAQTEAAIAHQNAAMVSGLQAVNGMASQVGAELDRISMAAAGVGLAIAAGLTAAIGSGVATAANIQQIRLGFESLLGSADAANAEIAKLNDLAAKTPFEFQDLVTGSQSLLAAGQGLGMTADGARALLTAVGDRLALMGKGADKIRLADLALTQMMMKGKVRAGEMNQLAEAGFDPWQRLSKELGKSMTETQNLVTNGMVPAAKMMQAIVNQPGAALGAMQKQSQTLTGLFSTLKDTVNIGLGKAAEPLVQGLTDAMPSVIAFTGAVVDAIAPIFDAASAAAKAVGYLLGAFNLLPGPIKAASVAAAIFGTMTLAGIVAIGAAFLALIPTIISVATAFATLDAAAGPVLLVMAAIGAGIVLWSVPVLIVLAEWTAALAFIGTTLTALYLLWKQDFLGMPSAVSAVADVLTVTLGAAFDFVVQKIEEFAAVIAERFSYVFNKIVDFLPALRSLASFIAGVAVTIYTSITSAFAGDGILSVFDSISHAFSSLVVYVLSQADRMIAALQPVLDAAGKSDLGAKARGELGAAIVNVQVAAGSYTKLAGQDLAAGGLDTASEISAFLESLIPKDMGTAVDDYKNALAGLTAGTEDAAGKSGHALKEHAKSAEDAAKRIFASLPKPGEQREANMGLFDLTGLTGGAKSAVEKAVGNIDVLYSAFQDVTASGDMTADALKFFQDKIKDANSALDAYKKAQEEARKAFQNFMKGLGQEAAGAFGKVGDIVSAAVQGFKAAGAFGAIAAVLVKLLTLNEELQGLVPALDAFVTQIANVFDGLIDGVGPVLFMALQLLSAAVSTLAPIFTEVGTILGGVAPIIGVVANMFSIVATLFGVFATLLQVLSPVLYVAFSVIYDVLQVVAVIILGIAYGIQTAWNAVLEAVAGVLEAVGASKAAKTLRKSEFDTDATKKALDTLVNTTYDAAVANSYNAVATAQAAEAADALTQSLTNVPAGFKINRYIYQAQAGVNPANIPHLASGGLVTSPTVALIGEAGPELVVPLSGRRQSSPSPLPSGAGSGGTSIIIESLMVVTDDPRALFDKIQAYAAEKAYLARGSTITLPSRYSTG